MSDLFISVQLPSDLYVQLTILGRDLGSSESWLATKALRTHIPANMRFLAAGDEGLRDMEAGEIIDHAVIVAEMAERRQRLLDNWH